jgi:hypothetical protein
MAGGNADQRVKVIYVALARDARCEMRDSDKQMDTGGVDKIYSTMCFGASCLLGFSLVGVVVSCHSTAVTLLYS